MDRVSLKAASPVAVKEPPRQFVRKSMVARILGVSAWSVDHYRRTDSTFPEPYWLSEQTPVWDVADLNAWIEKRRGKKMPRA